jgi:hypothetical protein
VIGVVWLLINESAICDGRDISGANEGDFAVPTRRVDLALVFDRGTMLPLRKVFCFVLLA